MLFDSSLLSTHNIARVLFITDLIISIAYKKFYLKKNIDLLLLSALLVCISFSSINSINIMEFLFQYKNIAMAIVVSIVLVLQKEELNIKWFTWTLYVSVIINLIIEILLYSKVPEIYSFLNIFFYKKNLSMFNFQLGRGRMFGDTLDEAFLPILFLGFFSPNKNTRYISILSIIGIFFTISISGWRSKLLICIFELAVCSFILFRKQIRIFTSLVLISTLILFLNYAPGINFSGNTVVSRFLLTDNEDIRTIKSRMDYWSSAYKMGISKPFIGVGLGNYFDNLSSTEKTNNLYIPLNHATKFVVIDDPHNIFFSLFATTGIVSVTIYLLLIMRYLASDFFNFYQYSQMQKALCFSYWGYFIYALFNPWLNFQFVMMFFVIRSYLYPSTKNV